MLFDNEFLNLLDKLEILLKVSQNSNLSGEKLSKKKGVGLDFKDYRQYQLGDDYRYIDWNLYSRLEQLFLKEFVAERGMNVHFLIDKSKSMVYPNSKKFILAKKIAAALSYISLTHFDEVEAVFFANKLKESTGKMRGKTKIKYLFNFLEKVECEGRTNIKKIANIFIKREKKAGLIFIISDFLDKDFLEAFKIIKSRGWKVFLLNINDNLNALKDQGQFILEDIETNKTKDIIIDEETIEEYKSLKIDYYDHVQNFANKYQINYQDIDLDDDLMNILLSVLKYRIK